VVALLAAFTLLLPSACSGDREDSPRVTNPSRSASSATPSADTPSVGEDLAMSEFARGYSAGWASGCDQAFRRTVAGWAHDFQIDYRVDDCYAFAPIDRPATFPSDLPADPRSAGEQLGKTQGCRAAVVAVQRFGVVAWGQFGSLVDATCS
jgi:hypothetical protein